MTKNDIIRMARQAGLQPYYDEQEPAIEAFANLVAEREREECAKVCESHVRYPSRLHFAAAIRARTAP